jgi:hypothetical protein
MDSRLSPALAEFAEGRWPDARERVADRYLMDRHALDRHRVEPPLHPSEREHYAGEFEPRESEQPRSPRLRVLAALARFLTIFGIGVAATLAWQSYGNAARRIAAGLSGVGWLAPRPAPAPSVPFTDASPDQLAAISRSLAGVRQSVDKLAADITKLQAAKQDLPPARTSGTPPAPASPAAVASRKPAPPVLPGPMIAR